jgi:hypothetical protein
VSRIVSNFIKLASQNKLNGIYENVPEEAYNHPDFPGIRSGLLKSVVKKSYFHAMAEAQEEKKHLVDGQIFHTVMEGAQDVHLKSKYGLISPEIEKFRHMSNSVRSHPRFEEVHRGSMREVTMFATCRYTGLLLRCRCDLWNPESGLITDYKTTLDASLEGFTRSARKFGYRMSACFYAAVTNWATKRQVDEFRIVAVEKTPPYFAAQYFYSNESFELETEAMVRGLHQIKQALLDGHRGYSTDVLELRY